MGSPGDPWLHAFPWLAATGAAARLRGLLEQAELSYQQSAAQLRATGQHESAIRVERFAARVRWTLDQPGEVRRLHEASRALRDGSQSTLADRILAGVLSLTGASRGNVQIRDPATGGLRIVAQTGFSTEFLEYFALVDDDRSACGRAARRQGQIVIDDVTTDPAFAEHRDAAAAAGFRAVWSTPLVDHTGRLLGVMSTHYRRPCSPPVRDLQLIERYAELASSALAARVAKAPGGGRPVS